MGRQHLCVLLLAAIALAVQASEDPTESLAGVHDLSELPADTWCSITPQILEHGVNHAAFSVYNHIPVPLHHKM